MRKTFLVMRQELITTFVRPSYLLFAFGIPILAVVILGAVKFIQGRASSNSGEQETATADYQLESEGFVDLANLVQMIPEDLQAYLHRYESENLAKQALQAGEITAYYIIPADYVTRGEVFYVYPDERSFLSDGQPWVIRWALTLNLLDGNVELADQIWNPVWEMNEHSITPELGVTAVSEEDCSRPGVACESNDLVRMMPSLLVALFYMAFMASSSMLFNSIGSEKENRTIELLMLSLNPRQLLAGKTLALGIAGLTQTLVWLLAIYASFNLGGTTLHLPEGFQFPVGIVTWGLVFFLGGFALYASLMAGAGALVPKMKEAGMASFIAMSPLLLGYMFGLMAPIADKTDAAFMIFLSLFPLTSPVVMVMRLTDGFVPLWQLLLSAGLLFVTAYGALNAVAAMFQAQNLLSGLPFSVKRYIQALAGR